MTEMTQREYWEEVESLAKSITEETFDSLDRETQEAIKATARSDAFDVSDTAREALQERLWETIDSHQWVIYTSYNFDVLRFSANEEYSITEFGADSILNKDRDGVNWAAMAFGALYADVRAHSAFGVLQEETEEVSE